MREFKKIFTDVFKDMPADANEVAQALVYMGKDSDLTKAQLEGLLKQVVELGHITGESAESISSGWLSMSSKWDMESKDMGGNLDYLYVQFGQGKNSITELISALQTGRNVFDAFHLTFQQSAQLLTTFSLGGLKGRSGNQRT